MYLRLHHGRTDPAEGINGWRFAGPTFGPLAGYVHTYRCTFRMISEALSSEVWLQILDDLIVWRGACYGDAEAFIAGPGDRA
jgi:hypothetical protein